MRADETHSRLSYLDVVIASGAALSGAVDTHGVHLVGIYMPSGWDAAALTFRASFDGTNWYNVYEVDGTEVSVTTAASRFVRTDFSKWAPINKLIIRSGTAGTPVNQTAERTLKLALRKA